MRNIIFKSTDAIRERLDILEEQDLADLEDYCVWHKWVGDEETDIITEVEIPKLGIRYVNDGADDELYDLHGAIDAATSAERSYRLA